jgi:c(7)-type cytochrome triheme protein
VNSHRLRAGLCLTVPLLGAVGIATAGQRVNAFDYRAAGVGTVTFDHGMHAARGFACLDCHTRWPATGAQLFQTQKQSLISMADHSGDGKCFACHNGKLAFSTCDQCHRATGHP